MDNDEYMTLDSWIDTSDLADNSDLLLQMDIEGGEYASLICASPGLMKRFRIMVIEFHSLKNLWNPEFFNIAKNVFDKILQTHYCVHIHPNNCCGIKVRFGVNIPRIAEFTFIRKDRVQVSGYQQDFPNPLDRDNMNTPSIVLPKDWYRI